MTKNRKHISIRVLIIVILLAAIALIAIDTYPGNTHLDFKEYKPTYLPANLLIVSSELHIQKRPQILPSFHKFINLDFNLPNSWIAEEKNDDTAFYKSWCQNYNSGAECRAYQTPHRQDYLLSSLTNSSNELSQSVYLIKGDTSIWITLTNYPALSEQEWGKVLDSLQVTHFTHPTIIRGSTRGP